ncbi:MAG: hypothetical protein IIY55_13545 [Blautia sp.]|nr:hypothetical protein [Blautia sp.]
MKRKLVTLLISGTMAASLLAGPAVYAESEGTAAASAQDTEDDSLLGALRGLASNLLADDGPLARYIGEVDKAGELYQEIMTTLDDKKDEIREAVDNLTTAIEEKGSQLKEKAGAYIDRLEEEGAGIAASLKEQLSPYLTEDGSIDTDALKGLAGSLLGSLAGEAGLGAGAPAGDNTYLYAGVMQVPINEFIISENSAYTEEEGAQLLPVPSAQIIHSSEPDEAGMTKVLADLWCFFGVIEGSNLSLQQYNVDKYLITLHQEKDGTYTVADAMIGDSEENLRAIIEAAGLGDKKAQDLETSMDMAINNAFLNFTTRHPEILTYSLGLEPPVTIEQAEEAYMNELLAQLETGGAAAAEEEQAGPAEEAPAEEPAADKASAEEAPAEEPAADKAPAEEAPAEEPGAGEAPTEETAAEGTSAEEAPAEGTTAEGTSAEEAPAEGTTAAGQSEEGSFDPLAPGA